MTTTQRPRPSRPSAPAPDPASRGLILVAVAVVLGVILLIKGGGVGFDGDDRQLEIGNDPATGSAEAPGDATTTTEAPPDTSVPPAELQVVALNAAGVNGYAAQAQQFLSVAGYGAVTPITAATQSAETIIHYVEGYQVDAFMVAQRFQVEAGQVQPMPDDPSSLALNATEFPAEANVAVILGPDVSAIVEGAAADAGAGDGAATDGGDDGAADAGTDAGGT